MRGLNSTRERPNPNRKLRQKKDIDELKTNFDVKSYLEETGVQYWTKGDNIGPGWIGLRCIYCHDHMNHLGVKLKTKQINCFKCGKAGDVLNLVMDLERITFFAALERLKEFPLAFKKEEAKVYPQNDAVQFPEEYEDFKGNGLPPVVERYLKVRRFSKSLIQDYKLGFCDYGYYQKCLIAPVYLDGKLVSWQAVDATLKAKVRYRDCPKEKAVVHNKNLLYGIDGVGKDQVILVEGLTDKWRMGRVAVAFFGKNYTDAQLALLLRKVDRNTVVKVMFDPDASQDGKKLAKELVGVYRRVRFVSLPDGRDPADLSDQEASHIISL